MLRHFLFLPLVLLLSVSCHHSSWNQGFQPKPVDNRNRDLVLKGNHHGYKDVDSVPVPLGPLKKPRYPAVLVSLEGEGNVYMAFVVDTRGLISETHVIYADDQKFADSVIEATKEWKFKPAKKNGRDVSYVWLMPVKFHISDQPYPRTIFRDGL